MATAIPRARKSLSMMSPFGSMASIASGDWIRSRAGSSWRAASRIGDLTRFLAGSGLSLPSLPFLTECSIGAAVATATHGTSPRWGTVSDFVQSLTVVLPSGEVKKIDSTSTPEERRAANVAVGWLGIIVEVELQAVAMPWVRFEELSMTIDDFLARMPNLAERYEHIWGHWSLGADIVVLRCLETSAEPQKGFRPYVAGNGPYWGDQNLKSTGVRRAKAALRRIANLHPALERAAKSVKGERPKEVGVTMQYSVERVASAARDRAAADVRFRETEPGSDCGNEVSQSF